MENNKTKEYIQQLISQMNKNEIQFVIGKQKAKMAYLNQTEYQAKLFIIFSMISYLVLLLLIVTSGTLAIMGPLIFPLALTLGAVEKLIWNKKRGIKKKLKSFSSSKSNVEKITEEIHYSIYSEKLKFQNKSIQQQISLVRINPLKRCYKNTDQNSLENLAKTRKNVDYFCQLLKKDEQKLDQFITKKVLYDKFSYLIDQSQKDFGLISASGIGGGLAIFYTFITSLFSPISLPIFLLMITSGLVTSYIYQVKKMKDDQKVLDQFNQMLEENAFSGMVTEIKQEYQNLDIQMNRIIDQISNTMIKLQEQKQIAEHLLFLDNAKLEKKERTTIKNVLFQEVNKEPIENREEYLEAKGPSFVLKRKNYGKR